MCTTVPPAKSNTGHLPPRNALRKPPLPHTMCATGKYTKNAHSDGEHHHGAKAHALGERSGNQRRRDDGEHELVDHERLVGNGGGVERVGGRSNVAQEQVAQVADERVARAEHQAVAAHRPQQGDHRHHGEALHHGAEHVLLAHQPAVEQSQAGTRHHQHQRGADQHPGVIAGRLGGGYRGLQGPQFGAIHLVALAPGRRKKAKIVQQTHDSTTWSPQRGDCSRAQGGNTTR